MENLPQEIIQSRIYEIRNLKVMLDSDLAKLYEVETKRINEAVKNNPEKFPEDFYFELTLEEAEILKSKISTSSWGGRRKATKVFTEQGVYLLATVLKSKVATEVTINIMRTFTKLREFALAIIEYTQHKNIEINFIKTFENLEESSEIFIDSLCSLGNTVYQILNIFFELHSKRITICTYNDNYSDSKLGFLSFEILINLLKYEKSNIKNRLLKSKKTLNKKYNKLRRKSRKKKKSLFDKHKRLIFKELNKNTTQVQILNMLKGKDNTLENITLQALGRYIKKQKELMEKKNYIDPYSEMRSIFSR